MDYITDPRTGELWWKRDDGVVCRGVLINIRETSLPDIPFPRTPDPVLAELVAEIRRALGRLHDIREDNKYPSDWQIEEIEVILKRGLSRIPETDSPRLEPETKGGQDG